MSIKKFLELQEHVQCYRHYFEYSKYIDSTKNHFFGF